MSRARACEKLHGWRDRLKECRAHHRIISRNANRCRAGTVGMFGWLIEEVERLRAKVKREAQQ